MSGETNKVKFGLKNAHYAVVTETLGVISYGTPVRIPGAVNLVLNPVGDKTEFYADDIEYFGATANQGYEGTLEIALLPDSFRKDVLGDKEDKNGAIFEDANAIPKNIALLYEFAGDKKAVRHVNYYCSVARPSIESSTKTKGLDVKTETLNISATPGADGFVKAKLQQGQTGYDTFFDEVYEFSEGA